MSSPANIQQFAALWINSMLCAHEEVEDAVSVFENERSTQRMPERLNAFCGFLVSTNRITKWQCEKLLMGKWKGFYLDHYVLLEQIDKDYESTYYKAKNTKEGQVVRIAVTPSQQPPHIRYTVHQYAE
jgi:hypothetical protein